MKNRKSGLRPVGYQSVGRCQQLRAKSLLKAPPTSHASLNLTLLTFNKDRGTFPDFDELDQMRPGLTKDDIYKILGRPHYDEGYGWCAEWDYLFHFYTPGVGVDPEKHFRR